VRVCRRCGRGSPERPNWRCYACQLDALLARHLDDGTGRISPTLQPVATLLAGNPDPEAVVRLLRVGKQTAQLLAGLATGAIPLSHEGLDSYGRPTATTKVRNLLVAAGVLPAVDPMLLDFERLVRRRLAALAGHPHERLLRQFALWQQLPRMRANAARRQLTYGAYNYANQQFVAAESFLTWLADRGRRPKQLKQADLDAWMLNARRAERERIRGFLAWAMTSKHLPALTVYVVPPRQREPVTQQERLDTLRRLATDDTLRLAARVAASLVLLYAQPLSRIRTLTMTDITIDTSGEVHIGLGQPPSPVPQPFADLLLRLTEQREHPKTAANIEQPWLFAGRNPGQPVNYITLHKMLAEIGVQPRSTRIRTLRQLVHQVPAPVVATALGLHQTTAHRQNINAGGTWSRYAAGD
jgi:hypothetical protein